MDDIEQLKINRAPVMTLWAATVAMRMGFDHGEALTLGRAVAGMNAQSKGRRLGIIEATPESLRELRHDNPNGRHQVRLLHRLVPVLVTDDGVRALDKGKATDPASVEKYLASKFGKHREIAERAMSALALNFSPTELAEVSYALYEKFRPEIPEGVTGWGAKGILDMATIRNASP